MKPETGIYAFLVKTCILSVIFLKKMHEHNKGFWFCSSFVTLSLQLNMWLNTDQKKESEQFN